MQQSFEEAIFLLLPGLELEGSLALKLKTFLPKGVLHPKSFVSDSLQVAQKIYICMPLCHWLKTGA